MDTLIFIAPGPEHEGAVAAYLDEHRQAGEMRLNGAGGLHQAETYAAWLRKLADDLAFVGITPERVPASTFFAVRASDGCIVGTVNIRHLLNTHLSQAGGHIGYGVRPSERRKGYATLMLALALDYCRGLGLDKAMVTCNQSNIGSARVIEKNGGVYHSDFLEDSGNVVRRYWIDLS